jgi:hypothetical protein
MPASRFDSQHSSRSQKEKAPESVSDQSVIRFLQNKFVKAQLRSSIRPKQIFLDLYSGEAGVTAFLRAEGFGCIPFDTINGSQFDLTRPCTLKLLRGWIRCGAILGVIIATECKSWSRARHGPLGSSWGPIRSKAHLFGIPGISDSDKLKVENGNRQLRSTCSIIRTCITCRVPCVLENPVNSMLWSAPEMLKLCNNSKHQQVNFDQCQFGTRWRKRTRISCWCCIIPDMFHKLCTGHGGVCSLTKKPHIVLAGCNPEGKLWSSLAQTYPAALCEQIGKFVINSYLDHGMYMHQ